MTPKLTVPFLIDSMPNGPLWSWYAGPPDFASAGMQRLDRIYQIGGQQNLTQISATLDQVLNGWAGTGSGSPPQICLDWEMALGSAGNVLGGLVADMPGGLRDAGGRMQAIAAAVRSRCPAATRLVLFGSIPVMPYGSLADPAVLAKVQYANQVVADVGAADAFDSFCVGCNYWNGDPAQTADSLAASVRQQIAWCGGKPATLYLWHLANTSARTPMPVDMWEKILLWAVDFAAAGLISQVCWFCTPDPATVNSVPWNAKPYFDSARRIVQP